MVEKGKERRENECRDLKESRQCCLAVHQHRSSTMVGYPAVLLPEESQIRGASEGGATGPKVLSIETCGCSGR